MSQAMLFAGPLVPGLDYREEFITAAEEAELLDRLAKLDLAPFRFHGWTGNRKTQSFGWRYDFDDASFTPADPLPDWLLPLREKPLSWPIPRRPISSRPLARYDLARASAGTATARCSRKSSASRLARRPSRSLPPSRQRASTAPA